MAAIQIREPLQSIYDDIGNWNANELDANEMLQCVLIDLSRVLGGIIEGLDPDNRAADFAALQAELSLVVSAAVSKLDVGPIIKRVLPFIIPTALAELEAIELSGDRVRKAGELIAEWGETIQEVGNTLTASA